MPEHARSNPADVLTIGGYGAPFFLGFKPDQSGLRFEKRRLHKKETGTDRGEM
jgi:hypothetical protein